MPVMSWAQSYTSIVIMRMKNTLKNENMSQNYSPFEPLPINVRVKFTHRNIQWNIVFFLFHFAKTHGHFSLQQIYFGAEQKKLLITLFNTIWLKFIWTNILCSPTIPFGIQKLFYFGNCQTLWVHDHTFSFFDCATLIDINRARQFIIGSTCSLFSLFSCFFFFFFGQPAFPIAYV